MQNIFNSIQAVKQISLLKGEFLFHTADVIKNFYLIKSGRIRMSRLTLDGKESVMYEGSSGETFAEASLFSENYHCDAMAIQDSTVDVFDKLTLLRALENDAQLSKDYMAMLARQVQKLRTQLELRNINSAHERAYKFLVLNADDSGAVVLSASLKEIAHQLGLAHETFYRTLSKLEKDQKITRNDNGDIFLTV